MNQASLNRAVAQATGESVRTIAELGFVPLSRRPIELEPEDYIIDWDRLERERRIELDQLRPRRLASA